MYVKHNERCKECKKRIFELLSKLFGKVEQDYNLHLCNKLDSFKENLHYSNLQNIFGLLIKNGQILQPMGRNIQI